jgi:hypothetical protein
MNLHYGCGMCVGQGWHNCDASPTVRLQRLPLLGAAFRRWVPPRFPTEVHYGDIVRGMSLVPNSCEAIFCSHVLEHLAFEDLRIALRNTYSYLKPGGTFRLIVPDFEQQVAAYLSNPDPSAISNFMGYTHLGRKTRPKGLLAWLREYCGNSHHLWMWDYKGLAEELRAVGFQGIRRCECGDARDPAFRKVEVADRFQWGLSIEAIK